MVRCVEFYDFWENHPNFCGKGRITVRRIDLYSKFLKSLKERGIEKSVTIGTVTEGSARPLLAVKSEDTYNKVCDILTERIKEGKQISAADIEVWIDLAERGQTPPQPVETPKEEENTCSLPPSPPSKRRPDFNVPPSSPPTSLADKMDESRQERVAREFLHPSQQRAVMIVEGVSLPPFLLDKYSAQVCRSAISNKKVKNLEEFHKEAFARGVISIDDEIDRDIQKEQFEEPL